MKPHHILKKFKGTQTGHGDGEVFEPGPEPVMLSDSLAEVAVKAGFAKPHHSSAKAEDRETKVVEPEEAKDDVPKKKKKG